MAGRFQNSSASLILAYTSAFPSVVIKGLNQSRVFLLLRLMDGEVAI